MASPSPPAGGPTFDDILAVQGLIEQCMAAYLTADEAAGVLRHANNINERFTRLVWDKLEEANKGFFRRYHLLCRLKAQVAAFNELLEQHAVALAAAAAAVAAAPALPPAAALMARPGGGLLLPPMLLAAAAAGVPPAAMLHFGPTAQPGMPLGAAAMAGGAHGPLGLSLQELHAQLHAQAQQLQQQQLQQQQQQQQAAASASWQGGGTYPRPATSGPQPATSGSLQAAGGSQQHGLGQWQAADALSTGAAAAQDAAQDEPHAAHPPQPPQQPQQQQQPQAAPRLVRPFSISDLNALDLPRQLDELGDGQGDGLVADVLDDMRTTPRPG